MKFIDDLNGSFDTKTVDPLLLGSVRVEIRRICNALFDGIIQNLSSYSWGPTSSSCAVSLLSSPGPDPAMLLSFVTAGDSSTYHEQRYGLSRARLGCAHQVARSVTVPIRDADCSCCFPRPIQLWLSNCAASPELVAERASVRRS